MTNRSSFPRRLRLRSLALAVLATGALLVGGIHADLLAAPGSSPSNSPTTSQNVDWMSSDMAQRLDLGFSVLVPTYIPGPFGSAPSVSASGGYYSLYWQLGGGSPTFLQISGTVGGGLPAGSPADLNNELFINANVQGYDAINDVTAIYDSVWWIVGGVLYQVEGLNVDIGSLSLANSLVTLVPPAPEPDPEPTVVPTEVPPSEPETGPSGPETVPEEEVEEPGTDSDGDTADDEASASETPADGETDPEQSNEDIAAEEDEPSSLGQILSAPTSVVSGGSATISISGAEASDLVTSDGIFADTGGTGIVDVQDGGVVWQAPVVDTETVVTIQLLVSQTGDEVDVLEITVRPLTDEDLNEDSDGTQGAVSPILGGDGTGGPQDLTIPFDPDAEP